MPARMDGLRLKRAAGEIRSAVIPVSRCRILKGTGRHRNGNVMFNLVRYFSLTSAIVMAIASVLVAEGYRRSEIDHHFRMVELDNIQNTKNFRSTFFAQYADVISSFADTPPDILRYKPELHDFDVGVTHLMAGLSIIKMKVFNREGRTIYSPVRDDIGRVSDTPAIREAASSGQPSSILTFRDRFVTADGVLTDRYVVATYAPYYATDGRLLGVFELYSDVTEAIHSVYTRLATLALMMTGIFIVLYGALFLIVRRADIILRKQHHELKEAHRFADTILNSIHSNIAILDTEGNIIEGNRLWKESAQHNGMPSGWTGVGDNYLAVCRAAVGEGRETALAAAIGIEEVIAGRRSTFVLDYPCDIPGHQMWFQMRVMPLRSGHGAVVVSHDDITDLKLAEQYAAKKDEMYRRLYESMQDPFAVVDMNGRLTLFNQAFQDLLGYSAEELKRLRYQDFTPEKWWALEETIVRDQVIPSEQSQTYRKEYIRKDGSLLPVELRAFLLRDKTGQPEAMWAIVRDVADKIRVEEEQALKNRQLAESNAELQHFAHTASHDLQEPLRMVGAYLALLERRYNTVMDEEGREFLRFATDGAKRMSSLIRDLLDYARVDSRAHDLEPVEMAAVLGEALSNLAVAVVEGGAQVAIEGPFPVVLGDRGQLVQLFQNLIGNAVKYRDPARPPRIRVAATRTDEGWEFTVADNGIGIAPEYFERIFLIFQRLHARGAYDGNGVGLAIVKRIVERHGGRIWLDSTPGRGTTVSVVLLDAPAV
jgi:PAS domain S-box-containing protein